MFGDRKLGTQGRGQHSGSHPASRGSVLRACSSMPMAVAGPRWGAGAPAHAAHARRAGGAQPVCAGWPGPHSSRAGHRAACQPTPWAPWGRTRALRASDCGDGLLSSRGWLPGCVRPQSNSRDRAARAPRASAAPERARGVASLSLTLAPRPLGLAVSLGARGRPSCAAAHPRCRRLARSAAGPELPRARQAPGAARGRCGSASECGRSCCTCAACGLAILSPDADVPRASLTAPACAGQEPLRRPQAGV